MNSLETTSVVCAHRVAIRYWDFESGLTEDLEQRLVSEGEERAKQCIAEGYVSGELNYLETDSEEEITGWWQIL